MSNYLTPLLNAESTYRWQSLKDKQQTRVSACKAASRDCAPKVLNDCFTGDTV